MSERMTIGQLAAAAGVNVETVRYYQRRELLALPDRPTGGIGRYPLEALTRLRFIKRSQSLGFSLDDVQALLGEKAGRGQARRGEAANPYAAGARDGAAETGH